MPNKIRNPKDDEVFAYFTKRSVYARGDSRKDNWGSTEHFVKVWVFSDEPNIANVEYSCPNCGHSEGRQFPYDEPFEFACDSCSKTIKVPKLDKRLGKKKAKKKAD